MVGRRPMARQIAPRGRLVRWRGLAGVFCSPALAARRHIDAVVRQIRTEISEACSNAADARGEPPLDEQ